MALKAAPKVKARPKVASDSAVSGRDPVVLRAASPAASGGTGGGGEDNAGESWHNYFDRLAAAGGRTAEAPTGRGPVAQKDRLSAKITTFRQPGFGGAGPPSASTSASPRPTGPIALADLDCILGEGELRDLKANFWRRYRQRYPPEVHPSDATISRVSREMGKRMLCIFSVWKVKSLQHQLLSSVKKRKLAPNLYTEDDDPDEAGPRDADSYLDRLFTLCLAYAMAGTMAVPAAMEEASLGADSTLFVAVPVDVVMMCPGHSDSQVVLASSTRPGGAHRVGGSIPGLSENPRAGHQRGLRCPRPALDPSIR